MSKLRTRVLLKEYVKEILAEDDYGGMMDAAAGSPYGMEFVSRDQLFDIFVQPFVNAVDHAAGKTKELSQKGITLLKVAFEAVATSLLPFLKDDYQEIFAHEKNEIDKIRSEYGQAYQATWDAFKNEDVMIAAFMYRPDLFLTAKFAEKAPKAAAKLLSVLSGGALDDVLGKLLAPSSNKKEKSPEGPGMPFESVIREDEGEGKPVNPLVKLLHNKKVKAVIAKNGQTQKLEQVGKKMVQGTLKQVFEQAQGVLGAKSLDDLQRKIGKKLPGMDKLQQVPQQERQHAEQQLMLGVKKSMKEFYVKSLEAQVKKATDAGVPPEHPYVHDYQAVINKIKAL